MRHLLLAFTILSPSLLAADWEKQALEDAKLDRQVFAYDGFTPNKMVCDTTLRLLPDGSLALFMLAGGDAEPRPQNYTGLTRSTDWGKTWSKLQPVNVGIPREGSTIGQGPTELIVTGKRATLFFATHGNHWGVTWKSWFISSDDNCQTWSKPAPLPGRLADRTFIRPSIVATDGRIIMPFQHYLAPDQYPPKPPIDPRCGVLISKDNGQTWSEHGNIRLTDDSKYHGWAEPSIVELSNNRIAMIIRADRLGGVLYYAESKDGGVTWPDKAEKTDIPNPGSKASLFRLAPDVVAMLHNSDPKVRRPLSLWISFDGMKTWPYQRVLVKESSDGKGALNYPDGFVSADRQYLHFAYDDHRHRAVYYAAKLPPLP